MATARSAVRTPGAVGARRAPPGGRAWRLRTLGGLVALALTLSAAPAQALKFATWNVIDYPNTILATRQPNLRTVVDAMDADLIIMQELKSGAGRDSFLTNVLNVVEPGQWAATAFFSTCESAMFYKPSKLTLTFAGVGVPTAGPRDVLLCTFRPTGYSASSTIFRVYSAHFKAGNPATSPADSTTRRQECWDLRNHINLAPAGTQFLIGGDTNFYGDFEGGYQALTVSTADNDGRAKDPNPIPGTWNSITHRFHHSQSPCNGGCPAANYSTGGLDDKFDFWLSSYNLQDGEALDILPGSAFPYGNDGQHYNQAVNGLGFNNAVGLTVANALFQASDHLPGIVVLQVPAKVAAGSAVDFGTVIIGAAAPQSLAVSNGAAPPADELNYSFTAPADFTAPGGGLVANAGAAANLHTLGMSTAGPGTKSGTLTVTTDDPDSASKPVLLSGRVLRHASPSLDSLESTSTALLDLGAHVSGEFPDSSVRVHNLGYDALQARLSVDAAVLSGGDGRFSLVGGFQGALLGDTGRGYTVHFDDAGATPDTTYWATLTFQSSDEPLPGASPAPDLVVTLRAYVFSGTTGTPTGGTPTALCFYPPRPNPLSREASFGFDLPRPAPVTLEIFDLSGRRVASLVSGPTGAGHHELRWRAMDESGARLPGGLYFARFSAPGLRRTERIALLP